MSGRCAVISSSTSPPADAGGPIVPRSAPRRIVPRRPRPARRIPRSRTAMSEPAFEPVLVLAHAARLAEGAGVRFSVVLDGVRRDAFAVRWHGRLAAYVNSCRHESLPLDFGDAHFFDEAYD